MNIQIALHMERDCVSKYQRPSPTIDKTPHPESDFDWQSKYRTVYELYPCVHSNLRIDFPHLTLDQTKRHHECHRRPGDYKNLFQVLAGMVFVLFNKDKIRPSRIRA